MSKYQVTPIDLSGLRTIPLAVRGGKVRMEDFSNPYAKGSGIMGLLESLPRMLAADSLRLLVESIVLARKAGKPIVWGLGGHVIKCGLSPVLADLILRLLANRTECVKPVSRSDLHRPTNSDVILEPATGP